MQYLKSLRNLVNHDNTCKLSFKMMIYDIHSVLEDSSDNYYFKNIIIKCYRLYSILLRKNISYIEKNDLNLVYKDFSMIINDNINELSKKEIIYNKINCISDILSKNICIENYYLLLLNLVNEVYSDNLNIIIEIVNKCINNVFFVTNYSSKFIDILEEFIIKSKEDIKRINLTQDICVQFNHMSYDDKIELANYIYYSSENQYKQNLFIFIKNRYKINLNSCQPIKNYKFPKIQFQDNNQRVCQTNIDEILGYNNDKKLYHFIS